MKTIRRWHLLGAAVIVWTAAYPLPHSLRYAMTGLLLFALTWLVAGALERLHHAEVEVKELRLKVKGLDALAHEAIANLTMEGMRIEARRFERRGTLME
jgi:hypothetical protein